MTRQKIGVPKSDSECGKHERRPNRIERALEQQAARQPIPEEWPVEEEDPIESSGARLADIPSEFEAKPEAPGLTQRMVASMGAGQHSAI